LATPVSGSVEAISRRRRIAHHLAHDQRPEQQQQHAAEGHRRPLPAARLQQRLQLAVAQCLLARQPFVLEFLAVGVELRPQQLRLLAALGAGDRLVHVDVAFQVGERGVVAADRLLAAGPCAIQQRQVAAVVAAFQRSRRTLVVGQRLRVATQAGVGLAHAQRDHVVVDAAAQLGELRLRALHQPQRAFVVLAQDVRPGHRQVDGGDVVGAVVLAGDRQRAAVDPERVLDPTLVLGQVALLQQVADQLRPVAQRLGIGLVLHQVLARLGQFAHAPVTDGDIEQQRLGVGLGAGPLVQLLRGHQVRDRPRLLAQQRMGRAAQAQAIGKQAVVADPARKVDAGLVLHHRRRGPVQLVERAGAAVMEAGLADAVLELAGARQAFVGVGQLALRILPEVPVAAQRPVAQFTHRVTGRYQALQFGQPAQHRLLGRFRPQLGALQALEQGVELRGAGLGRRWLGGDGGRCGSQGGAVRQQERRGNQPWMQAPGSQWVPLSPAGSPRPAGSWIVGHGGGLVRPPRPVLRTTSHFPDQFSSAAATNGGVASAPRWTSAL